MSKSSCEMVDYAVFLHISVIITVVFRGGIVTFGGQTPDGHTNALNDEVSFNLACSPYICTGMGFRRANFCPSLKIVSHRKL